MLFMGIDVGTQGVRCVVSDAQGGVAAAHSVPFETLNISEHPLWYEQSPAAWVNAAETAIRACTAQISDPDSIIAISIDGTSGTIVPLDAEMQPLTNGIMYNDPRAKDQAARIHGAMGHIERKLGYKFGASFSLPRVLWVHDELPEIYEKTYIFAHQADYIAGMLCGEYTTSDYSNALKTGYDLIDNRWPEEYADVLGLDLTKLPRIVSPGAPIAHVTVEASARLGLSTRTLVVGGSTDGYASALAAGAVAPGRWASIIGTTFVLKGVTDRLVIDPNGSSYSHMLPGGEWLLGGAANLGGRVLNQARGERSFDEMNAASEALIPTGVRCYPLTGRGERFPFVLPDCEPFYLGDVTGSKLYPAIMEGVGYAERLSLDHMIALGCPVGDTVYTTGGACRSALWLKIRASILNRRLLVPEVVDAAMGSALLAASASFGSLEAAAGAMLRYATEVEPDPELAARYAEIYARYREDIKRIYAVEV
ncbi:MAG: FGGY family carbohydrate kinase [Clostridia bacterium]|nr:FGGY family carbohydrate kinase [Clostridia bacterium]